MVARQDIGGRIDRCEDVTCLLVLGISRVISEITSDEHCVGSLRQRSHRFDNRNETS